ncbi:hypothetical protein [Fimbriiglobus ruber]|uniref:Uncharacterized protein n=1 Tax=Fimbriiglobus ruber TaxID=1908690 RepID=A0A225EDW9_9BACT|nr:hypothetical protein [Fimbriiglobus ruber]OWK46595.1 hypothetical protein FRUB_00294 [Fimbriiglobus ruber]
MSNQTEIVTDVHLETDRGQIILDVTKTDDVATKADLLFVAAQLSMLWACFGFYCAEHTTSTGNFWFWTIMAAGNVGFAIRDIYLWRKLMKKKIEPEIRHVN